MADLYMVHTVVSGRGTVLSHCKSRQHNTLSAACNGPIKTRCVCPGAIASMLKERPGIYPLIGVPWRILDECSSVVHNTVSAARGFSRGGPMPKCICPGAVIALRLDREHRRQNLERNLDRIGGRMAIAHTYAITGPKITEVPQLKDRNMPDLNRGHCRRPWNAAIVDGGFEDSAIMRASAKALCNGTADQPVCPVKAECKAWMLGFEKPEGSWGGVYAGLDVYDRRRAITDRARSRMKQHGHATS